MNAKKDVKGILLDVAVLAQAIYGVVEGNYLLVGLSLVCLCVLHRRNK